MSSYESLIGRAILSSDPAERQAAEDAVTVKLYASRMLRDQADTVVLESAGYAPSVMSGADWDALSAREDVQREMARIGARVLDGRVLFAKPARKRKPRVSRADLDAARDAGESI